MTKFNYTNLHFFDKSGIEIPILFNSNIMIEIPNAYGDNAMFYGIKGVNGELEGYYKKSSGNRYDIDTNYTAYAKIGETIYKTPVTYTTLNVNSNIGNEYSIDELTSIDNIDVIDAIQKIEFPSITFTGSLSIKPVSTDLVETESIYVLGEKDNNFVKIANITGEEASTWRNRYKILFFIDNRKNTEFRFFNVKNDEIIWSDRSIIDFNDATESGFKVNIGFCAKEEGCYEDTMYCCLLDTSAATENEPGTLYPLGKFALNGEAVGEDERYRTLFTNFGIPDPILYPEVFANTSLEEDKLDYIKLNENSKKLFLSYSEIFSYVGTYKALINAVKTLGYEDIFFKEWYKELGKVGIDNGYVAYDVSYQSDINANTINNVPIEERISLKKLNWLSMIYRINKEIEGAEDRYGFPAIKEVYDYNNTDILVKLISLRKWLNRYIVGINCRIIDIAGEGIYFERYKLDSYGSFQQVLDWDNQKNLIPYIIDSLDDAVLINETATLKVDVGLTYNSTLEDLRYNKFEDFCVGYIGKDYKYHHMSDDARASCYVGNTFDCLNQFEKYELKATTTGEDFLFNSPEYVTEDSPSVRVHNNEIMFNPYELLTKEKLSVFTKLPIIKVEKANIRKKTTQWVNSVKYAIYPDTTENTLESYFIKNNDSDETAVSIDYITLIPPTYAIDSSFDSSIGVAVDNIVITTNSGKTIKRLSKYLPEYVADNYEGDVNNAIAEVPMSLNTRTYGLTYSAINQMGMSLFSILGYEIEGLPDLIDSSEEYYLEILDGKMMFDDVDNDRKIFLNFNYDNALGEQTVQVNIIYTSEEFSINSYGLVDNSFSYFIPGNDYTVFASEYSLNPENVIRYNNIHDLLVHNTGNFAVDVYAMDIHNNIFAKRCENNINVNLPSFSLLTYTNTPISENEFNIAGDLVDDSTLLHKEYVDFCIYNNAYFINNLTKTVDSVNENLSIEYPTYSYSSHNVHAGDYLHFMNTADKYMIDALDYSYRTTNNDTYTGYYFILERNGLGYAGKVIEKYNNNALLAMYTNGTYIGKEDLDEFRISDFIQNLSENSYDYEYADVNFMLYNELGNYPVMQTYATMINEEAVPYMPDIPDSSIKYKHNKFRLCIPENSSKSYIWTSVKEHVALKVLSKITDELKYYDMTEDASLVPWIEMGQFRSFDMLDAAGNIFLNKVLKSSNIEINDGAVDASTMIELFPQLYNDVMDNITLRECDVEEGVLFNLLDSSINVFHLMWGNAIEENIDVFDGILRTYLESETSNKNNAFAKFINNDMLDGVEWMRPDSAVYKYFSASKNIMIDDITTNALLNSIMTGSKADIITCGPANGINVHNKLLDDLITNLSEISHLYKNVYNNSTIDNEVISIDSYLRRHILESSLSDSTELENTCKKVLNVIVDEASADPSSFEDSVIFAEYYAKFLVVLLFEMGVRVFHNMYINSKNFTNNGTIDTPNAYTLHNRYIASAMFDYVNTSEDSDEENDSDEDTLIDIGDDIFTDIYFKEVKLYDNTVLATRGWARGIYNMLFNSEAAFCKRLVDPLDTYKNVNIELYDKLLSSLVDSEKAEIEKNWITAYITIDGVPTLCYAVAVEYDITENYTDKKITKYLKHPSYLSEGLTNAGDEEEFKDPKNALPNLAEMITKPYITAYVQPTWKAEILLYGFGDRLNQEEEYNERCKEFGLPIDDYFCFEYMSNDFRWHFNKGEMVKLVFVSLTNNEYIGQAAYEVVGYDTEQSMVIVRGKINNAYIRKDKKEVWARVKETYAKEEAERIIAELDAANGNTPGSIIDIPENKCKPVQRIYYYHPEGSQEETSIPINYRLPVRYVNGEWQFKVLYFVNGVPRSIELYELDLQEKVKMYVSYAHNAFVDYTMNAISAEETPDGKTHVEIPYSNVNNNKLQYVDDTFVMYSKDFDINEGLYAWMNTTQNGVPNILNNNVYKYTAKNSVGFVPVALKSNNSNIVFKIDFNEDLGMNEETSFVHWKIYKKSVENNDREFKFESYNKVLYLDYDTPGIYDIEANVYDKYGNTVSRLFKGAYKVVC